MTRQSERKTDSGSTRTLAVSLAVLSAIAVAAVALGAFGGPVLAQEDTNTTTVSVGDATVGVNETATVDVTLSDTADGLSGYDLDLTLEDPAVANISGASVPGEFALNETSVNGSTVSISGLDGNEVIQPGDGETVLATVELTGVEAGESGLALSSVNIDDENGSSVNATLGNGTLTVEAAAENTTTDTPEDNATDTPEDNATETPGDNDTNETAGNASVVFENQTSDGTSVTVESVTVPEGGFIAIHNASLLNGTVQNSVVGVSEPLDNGTHENVSVTLFDVPGQDFSEGMNLEENQTLIAMPHFDTNDNGVYDFITSNATEDGPYRVNGSAVVDPAFITVEDDDAPADEDAEDDDQQQQQQQQQDDDEDGDQQQQQQQQQDDDDDQQQQQQQQQQDDDQQQQQQQQQDDDDDGDGKTKAGDDGGDDGAADDGDGATDGGNGKSKMGGGDGDDGAADGGNGKSKSG